MADGRTYYALSEDNCKFETMTKEQILSAIRNAVQTGYVGYSEACEGIREINNNRIIKIWIGTQAEYNAIEKSDNVLYICSDDASVDDLIRSFEELKNEMQRLETALTEIDNVKIVEIDERLSTTEEKIDEIEDTLDEINTELTSTQEIIDDENEIRQTVQTQVARAQRLAQQITSADWDVLYQNTSFKFNTTKTVDLGVSVNNYSRIVIMTKVPFVSGNDLTSTYTYNRSLISANSFVFKEYVWSTQLSTWNIYEHTMHFYNDSLVISKVQAIQEPCELYVFGLL